MEYVPVRYHLEIYEGSFGNDASFVAHTTTPTPAFSVGDLVEHRGFDRWHAPPRKGETFRVKAVRHIVWEIDKSHIGHTLQVCVEVVPATA